MENTWLCLYIEREEEEVKKKIQEIEEVIRGIMCYSTLAEMGPRSKTEQREKYVYRKQGTKETKNLAISCLVI